MIIDIASKFYTCTIPTHAFDLQVQCTHFNFCIFVFVKVFKFLHHLNLLFSLVNISNILFYTIFTHAYDLEVKVTDFDIFIFVF